MRVDTYHYQSTTTARLVPPIAPTAKTKYKIPSARHVEQAKRIGLIAEPTGAELALVDCHCGTGTGTD